MATATATANQRRGAASFTMPTLDDISGQFPAVIEGDYRVISDKPRQIPVFVEPKAKPSSGINIGSAMGDKTIPEALAYHLACIEALSRSGNDARNTVRQNVSASDNLPRNNSENNSFSRIKEAFD